MKTKLNYHLAVILMLVFTAFSLTNAMAQEKSKKQLKEEKKLEKQKAIADEKQRKQTIVIWAVVLGLVLVIAFAVYVFKSLNVTRKQKVQIELKSKQVEEKQKEILDSIHYAKRIQTALIPSEKYISKNLNRLRNKG